MIKAGDHESASWLLNRVCKNISYPTNIISYTGMAHMLYVSDFIRHYFELNSDQYYQINPVQKWSNKNVRYGKILCKLEDGILLPKFRLIDTSQRYIF